MITVNGRCAVRLFNQWGRCPNFLQPFLKTLTEGAVTTEAGGLFQYSTTLTKNADPLLQRWLAPWSALQWCPFRPRRLGGRKNKFGSTSNRPHLEGGNQVSPKSTPLQLMKAQPLQSLLVGEATRASYHPCS